jgi:uncharacterized repeat protein (TIGR03803 family)
MKFASTVSGRIVAALTLGYVASAYTEKGVRTMKTDSSLPGNQLTFRTLAWAAILGFLATSPSGTEAGGDNHGDGTVFKIDALGNKTVLHQFIWNRWLGSRGWRDPRLIRKFVWHNHLRWTGWPGSRFQDRAVRLRKINAVGS